MFARFLLLVSIALVLSACSMRNPARVELCLVALAGLEPGDTRIVIEDISGQSNVITLAYRGAPGVLRELSCSFRGSATSIDQLDMLSVTMDGRELGAGRLFYLRSHWLTGAGDAVMKQRIVRPVQGLFPMGAGTGQYLQAALSALPIAAAYVLLALGFALIHGITGRMNIAHGEFATMGAYAGYAGFMAAGQISAPAGLAMALLLALAASASAGFLTIRSVFIPLARREGLMLLVASVGLILVFEEFIRIARDSREVWLPPLLSEPMALTLPPYVVTVTPMHGVIVTAAVLVCAGVLALIRFTRFGRAWRAVSDDPLAARFMGLDPALILSQSAVMSAGLAGLAGLAVLLAYGNAHHSMGLMMSFKAMVAALIGGMGSPMGAVGGALALAAIETFWAVLFGGTYRDIAVFTIMIALLTLRPEGLAQLARR